MKWMLLLVWTGVQGNSPIAAPTTLGPFESRDACRHAEGQILAMATDMASGLPLRSARRAELVSWRCIEVRP